MSSSDASPRLRLTQLGLNPKRSLGQHFLHDRAIVQRICDVANLPSDAFVVEIGPGLGILTEALSDRVSEVIAIEKDEFLAEALAKVVPENVEVVNVDALQFDPEQLGERAYHLVANLPYNVATAILRRFLDSRRRPVNCTIMLQREVAERMIVRPPDMGILAVAMQFHGTPKIAFRVGRGAFTPPPRIVSSVIHIEVFRKPPLPQEQFAAFFDLVRAGFGNRRKQLKNSLEANAGLDAATISGAFTRAVIPDQARAQELDVDDWLKLYEALNPVNQEGGG